MSEIPILNLVAFGIITIVILMALLVIMWSINWLAEKELERERRRRND